jgi:cell division protein FtsB
VSGENGLLSYLKMRKQITETTEKLDGIKDNLKSLQRNVELLSNKTLDKDMLEERCRAILNYSYPDEITIKEKSILGE